MRSGSPRLTAILCMAVALGSCNSDKVVSPDTGILFASGAAGNAPSGLNSLAISPTQINLHWTDNSNNEDGFEIQRSVNGLYGPFALLAPTAPNAVTYNNQGLTAEKYYCYQVRAFRKLGKNTVYTGFSNVTCSSTPPVAPSNTNATPISSMAVAVTWTDNSTTEDGFRVERAPNGPGPWTLVSTAAPNTTVFNDAPVSTEQMVCYRVTASSPSGASVPSNVDCTTPPAAPENLTATSPAEGIIDLAWADRSAVEDGYELQRTSTTAAWSVIALLPANAVSYRDATVSTDVQYSYRVHARKDGGFSDFSALATAVSAATPPLAPSGVAATPTGSTQVYVSWADNSRNEDGFRVERSRDGVTGWVTAYTTGSGDGNPQGLYDGQRTPDERVCYRVFAFNGKGTSSLSNIGCTTPPAAPTDLVASTASNYAIDLHWTNNSTVADGYEVQRVYYGYYYYEYYETIATLGSTATSYRDGGHGPGEYYTYRILALKDGGVSDPSNQAAAFTDFPPAAPTGLTAVPIAVGRINIGWTYPTGESEYFSVERCQGEASACGDANFEALGWVEGNIRAYSDGAVQTGITYTYRVRAYVRGQLSEPSNTSSATAP